MSRFISELKKERFPITFEVPSPRGGNVEEYIEKIKNYDFLEEVVGLNVCNNPVGRVMIDPAPYAGRILHEVGVEPIAHLTCRDSTLSGLQRWLLGAQSLGVKTILAMTGDYGVGDYPAEEKVDHINSLELITGIKQYLNEGELMPELSAAPYRHRNRYLKEVEKIEKKTGFQVGGVIISHRSKEPKYAAQKVEAGADFFQTQICYKAEEILDFLEEFEKRRERNVPVLIGTTPFSSKAQIRNLLDAVPQVTVPDSVKKRLSKADDTSQESIEFSVEFYKEILDGMEDRGLESKIGAHIIPVKHNGISGEIIRRLSEL
ncbi:MAG: methylenetetrahydrofolate reductase [Candidatus Natronoplasma sp.]